MAAPLGRQRVTWGRSAGDFGDFSGEQPDEPVVVSEVGAVRTLYVYAPSMSQLATALEGMLSEYVTDDDELHVSYSAMPVGWQEQPPRPFGTASWTQITFQYSALVVLRPRSARNG